MKSPRIDRQLDRLDHDETAGCLVDVVMAGTMWFVACERLEDSWRRPKFLIKFGLNS